jgi:hypothetical protein
MSAITKEVLLKENFAKQQRAQDQKVNKLHVNNDALEA